ncbi:MAG TPA: hypothetical protein VMU94_15360 [Streptosporangiaceae bacterium]|nr:hypothetical protein [Streptosporangiaceae bacterium]
MAESRTGYVDESLRVGSGLYVLAAVIVADLDADRHREALRALLYRGQERLHWRDESHRRRGQLIEAVCGLGNTGAVVIATGMAPNRQERARRKCIERLLAELAGREIASVVFERRHHALDARDRAMIAALRRQQALPATFRAAWQPPAGEPLLWLPDIAAGAASLAETGDDSYWNELAAAFTTDRIALT